MTDVLVLQGSPPSGGNESNEEPSFITYRIPNTPETIRYHLIKPLDPNAMRQTVLAAYNVLWMHINFEGDGDLPASQDPFIFDAFYGASIIVSSRPQRQLTWSYVKSAVGGLNDVLYLQKRYYQTDFEILDSHDGLVGAGKLVASSVSNNVTTNSQLAATS